MSGIFITVEGPDGAGKTTLIRHLLPLLEAKMNSQVISTREPGGNEIAEKIRSLILDPSHTQMDPRTEALLYAASRCQHLVDKILPALAAGACVICDRFVDSSIAYQGVAREIGVQGVRDINHFATDGRQPDLTLYVDIPSEEGLRRIHANRSDEVNRLDLEGLAFHQKVRQGYLSLKEENPERIVLLDGQKTPDQLAQEALTLIATRFPKKFEGMDDK